MLNWIVFWVGSYLFGRRRAAPDQRSRRGRRRSVVGGHPGEGEAPRLLGRSAPPGPPHRLLHRDRRARRVLAHAQPDDARLRGARGRPQPRGGALRRHQRRRATTSSRWRSPGRSPVSPERSTSSAGSSASTSRTSRPRPSGSSGIAVALLGRNTAVGVGLSALLFAALQTGTASRNLDPSDLRPRARRRASPSSSRGSSCSSSARTSSILSLLGRMRQGRRDGRRRHEATASAAGARLAWIGVVARRASQRSSRCRRSTVAQPGRAGRDRPRRARPSASARGSAASGASAATRSRPACSAS